MAVFLLDPETLCVLDQTVSLVTSESPNSALDFSRHDMREEQVRQQKSSVVISYISQVLNCQHPSLHDAKSA